MTKQITDLALASADMAAYIAALPTAALLGVYNYATGKDTTKFSRRAKGEAQTLAVLTALRASLSVTAPVASDSASVDGFETHGHVRCPSCATHLSNGVGTHGGEVNGKTVKHDKFEFVCLACGEEFGPALPAKREVNVTRSAAIAASWGDVAVADARSARNQVKVDGVVFRSVRAAFVALGLPLNKHIKFRMELKARGELPFGEHDFVLVPE